MKTRILLFTLYYFLFNKVTDAQWARTPARTPPANASPTPRPSVIPASYSTSSPTPVPLTQATKPVSPAPPASPITPTASSVDRKSSPETSSAATVYILPAPPVSPKITVLDPSVTTLESYLESYYKQLSANMPNDTSTNLKETPSNSVSSKFKETSQNLASNLIANRPSFKPPPAAAPLSMLPNIKDETPSLMHNKFSQLPKSEPKVCNACAELIEKLPIFKFDQELLSGFLTGLGL